MINHNTDHLRAFRQAIWAIGAEGGLIINYNTDLLDG